MSTEYRRISDYNAIGSPNDEDLIPIVHEGENHNITFGAMKSAAKTSKVELGLNNVDNTSDVNKPISVQQQLALDDKADKSDTYTKAESNALLDGVVKTTSNQDILGTKNFLGDVLIQGQRANRGLVMFSAWSTSNQATGSGNGDVRVTFDGYESFNGDGMFNNSAFIPPSDGWIIVSTTLSIIGGTGNDDSMSWGYWRDSGPNKTVTDNWRYHSPSTGIEFTTSFTCQFPVVAGEAIRVGFNGVAYSLTLMSGSCYFNGIFIPDSNKN